jgi:hypothetical protein
VPDWFQTGLQSGADTLVEAAGRSVMYTRGTTKASLTVVAGRTLNEDVDDSGLMTRVVTRDYIIRQDDFEDAGFEWPPKRDDLLVDTDGTYKCLPIPGEGETRKRDTDDYSRRTHWKQIA